MIEREHAAETRRRKRIEVIIREYGISDATFYNWKAKYGGMEVSDVKKIKDLEEENRSERNY